MVYSFPSKLLFFLIQTKLHKSLQLAFVQLHRLSPNLPSVVTEYALRQCQKATSKISVVRHVQHFRGSGNKKGRNPKAPAPKKYSVMSSKPQFDKHPKYHPICPENHPAISCDGTVLPGPPPKLSETTKFPPNGATPAGITA